MLFYVKSWEATRLYVSPQYAFGRSSSSADTGGASTGHSVAATIGAQHTFGSRFGVYAEAGLGRSRSKNPVSTGLGSSSITSTSIGTRSTIGGVVFF